MTSPYVEVCLIVVTWVLPWVGRDVTEMKPPECGVSVGRILRWQTPLIVCPQLSDEWDPPRE